MASLSKSETLVAALAPHQHSSQQLNDDAEAVVLTFLRNFNVGDRTTPASPVAYRPSQLLTIAQTFFVLGVVYSSSGGGAVHDTSIPPVVCTERDLYYRNPPLYGHQRLAHASIERLCRWLDVARVSSTLKSQRRIDVTDGNLSQVFCKPQYVLGQLQRLSEADSTEAPVVARLPYTRESIGITAAGKSTLAGALVMELCRPPEHVDLSTCGPTGLSLTYSLATRLIRCYPSPVAASPPLPPPPPSALVLIEKESIYHAVLQCASRTPAVWRRSYAFLCTKGYPCVAAQLWLRRLHAVWPSLELHVLVDGDPHGLCIALTAMGLLGTQARRPVGEAAAALLPFHFTGVRPSRVFDAGATSVNSSASSRDPALPTSTGTPLTQDDRQVLRRLRTTLQKALTEKAAAAPAPLASVAEEAAATRRTLTQMVREVDWMERSGIKCELQLACKAYESPLHYIDAFIAS